jgi:hypothetical protein
MLCDVSEEISPPTSGSKQETGVKQVESRNSLCSEEYWCKANEVRGSQDGGMKIGIGKAVAPSSLVDNISEHPAQTLAGRDRDRSGSISHFCSIGLPTALTVYPSSS